VTASPDHLTHFSPTYGRSLEDEEEFTYKVVIWDNIKEHVSKAKAELAKPLAKRKRTYEVRWRVTGRPKDCSETYKTHTLAKNRQSELRVAVSKGEKFHVETGLPASEYWQGAAKQAAADAAAQTAVLSATCFERFTEFFDAKWPQLEPKSRAALSDALSTVTAAVVVDRDGAPDRRVLNHVLVKYVFNLNNRSKPLPSAEYAQALAWIRAHSSPASDFTDDIAIRKALEAIKQQPTTGKKAARSTVARKRAGLHQAWEYLLEQKIIGTNPLDDPKWQRFAKVSQRSNVVDRRVVANPRQIEALIDGCAEYGRAGEKLQAFFSLCYYAFMRPGEAMVLTEDCFTLPPEPAPGQKETEWGRIRFATSDPQPEDQWTDDARGDSEKSLKQREKDEDRDVPLHPNAVARVRRHIKRYNISPGGRMFTSLRGGGDTISKTTYAKVWRWVREHVLTRRQFKSKLVKRPYDLRHGGVSLLLNAGVPPTLIADWAGHGVDVLMKIYAKCIDGQEEMARRLIEKAVEFFFEHDEEETSEPDDGLDAVDADDEDDLEDGPDDDEEFGEEDGADEGEDAEADEDLDVSDFEDAPDTEEG
jgi:integrase